MLIETRPRLQSMKQQRAAELAEGIGSLFSSGKSAEADQLMRRVLRLDPLNRTALAFRGRSDSDRREQARERAVELRDLGEAQSNRRDFEAAVANFEEALALEPNPATEKLLESAKIKANDCRTGRLLLKEVLEDLGTSGNQAILPAQMEAMYWKLARAARLDPHNDDVKRLRVALRPAYEARHSAAKPAASGAVPDRWYDEQLREAIKARKGRQFAEAEYILKKLEPVARDQRVAQELRALVGDREAHDDAQLALATAERLRKSGQLEAARTELDSYCDRRPLHASIVQKLRRSIVQELERLESASGAGEGAEPRRTDANSGWAPRD